MKLHNDDVQSFALAALKTFNLKGVEISEEVSLKELEDELRSELEDLNSEETLKARCKYFAVPNAGTSDYREKFLELEGGKKVVYGIRHMGGNKDVPFIQLYPNFSINGKSEALEIYERVKSEFEVFNPLYVGFWSNNKNDADFFGSSYMVSTARKMRELGPWEHENKIQLSKVLDDSYYQWYKEGYEEFHSEFPELKAKVTLNSLDSMEDSLEQGLIQYVLDGDEKVGLIIGERSPFLGYGGIYFHEIYIVKKWKGKGLAKAIQRKFVVELANEEDYIWGTIDSANIPSYKTALSNGRRPIRIECFVAL
jgi:L-amino acid N-acyltransferase YncA